MSIKTRAQIARELEPGLNRIVGMYAEKFGEWEALYEKDTSDRSFEEMLMTYGLGTAPVKLEGEAITFDKDGESFTTRVVHETIALGYQITEEAMEDNLYTKVAKRGAKELSLALSRTKEIKGALPFINGFTTFQTGDNVALFSASHPVYGGSVQSNLLTGDISETALEDAYTTIMTARDERGNLLGLSTKSLHFAPQNQFTVRKLLESELTTTPMTNVAGTENVSNSNNKNIVAAMTMFPGGTYVHKYFTDPDAWFIKTDASDGGIYFQRRKLRTKMDEDFRTGNLLYKADERYSFTVVDWRQFYASAGA